MFWERTTIEQMMRLITRARPESGTGHANPDRPSGDRFGCCPSCRAFVRIGPASDPPGDQACPECHRPIRELDALWPAGEATS
jgi:hypothetical protein